MRNERDRGTEELGESNTSAKKIERERVRVRVRVRVRETD
jgi:hypothetical protein